MKGLKGLLKCDVHDESFNTPEEFYEHKDLVPHGATGSTRCEDCKCENCPQDPNEMAKGKILKTRCIDCEEINEKNVLEKIKRKEREKKEAASQ